ncbi:hypothetical protein M427DRAFT_29736 [Gonapodya prolifera JEL478]|uniref:Uncharacterized protein n=1 Tax=Gonapodya prolifera (strain JEL478) TaxID=1344416 RepID=A0A139ANT7_GONPJ|nr:hypothetical protein M427DRAFT_29736 [Gonapodya prolifera JEL478]|eukprot:KXS18410.1 hypothetical protein M427DRAFT_29736 [Gonapodya prolifera JEL478]
MAGPSGTPDRERAQGANEEQCGGDDGTTTMGVAKGKFPPLLSSATLVESSGNLPGLRRDPSGSVSSQQSIFSSSLPASSTVVGLAEAHVTNSTSSISSAHSSKLNGSSLPSSPRRIRRSSPQIHQPVVSSVDTASASPPPPPTILPPLPKLLAFLKPFAGIIALALAFPLVSWTLASLDSGVAIAGQHATNVKSSAASWAPFTLPIIAALLALIAVLAIRMDQRDSSRVANQAYRYQGVGSGRLQPSQISPSLSMSSLYSDSLPPTPPRGATPPPASRRPAQTHWTCHPYLPYVSALGMLYLWSNRRPVPREPEIMPGVPHNGDPVSAVGWPTLVIIIVALVAVRMSTQEGGARDAETIRHNPRPHAPRRSSTASTAKSVPALARRDSSERTTPGKSVDARRDEVRLIAPVPVHAQASAHDADDDAAGLLFVDAVEDLSALPAHSLLPHTPIGLVSAGGSQSTISDAAQPPSLPALPTLASTISTLAATIASQQADLHRLNSALSDALADTAALRTQVADLRRERNLLKRDVARRNEQVEDLVRRVNDAEMAPGKAWWEGHDVDGSGGGGASTPTAGSPATTAPRDWDSVSRASSQADGVSRRSSVAGSSDYAGGNWPVWAGHAAAGSSAEAAARFAAAGGAASGTGGGNYHVLGAGIPHNTSTPPPGPGPLRIARSPTYSGAGAWGDHGVVSASPSPPASPTRLSMSMGAGAGLPFVTPPATRPVSPQYGSGSSGRAKQRKFSVGGQKLSGGAAPGHVLRAWVVGAAGGAAGGEKKKEKEAGAAGAAGAVAGGGGGGMVQAGGGVSVGGDGDAKE